MGADKKLASNVGSLMGKGSANGAPTNWPMNPQIVHCAGTTASLRHERLKGQFAVYVEQTSGPPFAPFAQGKPRAVLPEAKWQYV
ncbi:hypothetical protein [Specibacter sp. NPDC078692]|uniref:hypothetical protein n=1 Tax=Specibacter sp. NPDC078692 TaxID=3155818 RepID=UPI0034314FB5